MQLPRFSVRSMCYLVLILALDLSWILKIGRAVSLFNVGLHLLDMPLFGLFNVLAIAGYGLLVRRTGRPFLIGFVSGGLLCSVAYVLTFRTYPSLASDFLMDFALPIQDWTIPRILQPGNPGYTPRYVLCLATQGVIGTIPLVILSTLFGLLIHLVAKRKVSWMVAVAIVAILIGSAGLGLRRRDFQRLETYYEEVCQVLSSEAAVVSKELDKLRAAEDPDNPPTEKHIKDVEEKLATYEQPLAKNRRQLEIYRKAVRRPWLSAE